MAPVFGLEGVAGYYLWVGVGRSWTKMNESRWGKAGRCADGVMYRVRRGGWVKVETIVDGRGCRVREDGVKIKRNETR